MEHQAVLLPESINLLNIQQNQYYVDATFGLGGHSQEILKKNAKVIAFEFDRETFTVSKEKFKQEIAEKKLLLFNQNFTTLAATIQEIKQKEPDLQIKGILFDFGTNALQLKSKKRGFSFWQSDHLLDMRMDQNLGVKAHDLLAILPEKQLSLLFWQYGGEKQARVIAKEIVKQRQLTQIMTVNDLNAIIKKVKHSSEKIHPSTKVFQALRIAVNDELQNIHQVLPQAFEILDVNGRLVCISFHEGEDRIVKHFFKNLVINNKAVLINKKPIIPSSQELEINPRSRSAKLRGLKKKL